MIPKLVDEYLLHLKLLSVAIDRIIKLKGYWVIEIVILFPFVQILYVALVERALF